MDWSTLVSTAVGVLVGGIAPVLVVLIQGKQQRRTELIRVALEAALKERADTVEQGGKLGRKYKVYPLSTFVYHQWRLLQLLEEGKLTDAEMKKLYEESERQARMFDQLEPDEE